MYFKRTWRHLCVEKLNMFNSYFIKFELCKNFAWRQIKQIQFSDLIFRPSLAIS